MSTTGRVTSTSTKEDNRLVISYLTLRKAVGSLGIALPFILAIGGLLVHKLAIQSSMSHYYHSDMRDIFVGILCAIAVFLISYKGYNREDDYVGDLAGLFAIGVALIPTAPDLATGTVAVVGGLHLLFATGFFCTLAYFSLFLFTKTNTSNPTPQKKQRNTVYKVSGFIILIAIGLIGFLAILPDSTSEPIKSLKPVFWLESIAIIAFGISWLTKGEAILKDET